MGGAIGAGIPLAVGAAIGLRTMGRGNRRVLALQADGSAMYTIQGLWTQAARKTAGDHRCPVEPQVSDLDWRVFRSGSKPGTHCDGHARSRQSGYRLGEACDSLGVEAATADTLEACADLMTQSFRRQSPFLIELSI